MKIRLISDIHLEFDSFELEKMPNEQEQVLCIAGDVNPSKCLWEIDLGTRKSTETFFDNISNRFKAVIYITGNHEYYNGDVALDDKKFKQICDVYNFHFLQNGESIKINDVTFIGATLWTDFQSQSEWVMVEAQRGMNDFQCISDSDAEVLMEDLCWNRSAPFTPHRALIKHYSHRNNIFQKIKETRSKYGNDQKIVVMTHHAPHENSIHERFKSSIINGAYYSDLEYDISVYKPNLWVHGHVHDSFDYMISDTRVVCNPYGYSKYEVNPEWDPKKIIEV